ATPLRRVHPEGVFEADLPDPAPGRYRMRVTDAEGRAREVEDPYRFGATLAPERFAAFTAGTETRLDRLLGAHPCRHEGCTGTRFAVWAPRARAVNLIGSFNRWEGRTHPMRPVGSTGVWELFLPGVGPGALYKYEIRPRVPGREGGADQDADVPSLDKADPLGFRMELRPRTASVVTVPPARRWKDRAWMAERAARDLAREPVSIYEAHLGSWRRSESGEWLGYPALAETLLPWVKELGFTHVELLPLTEHPHDASWGYQTVGYFALTARYGTPEEFRAFVDEAHRLGLGVLLDWVPAHFPLDAHGLWRFDGFSLYEHPDPRRGHHPEWGTAIFDFGRPEVISFLVSSARYWLEEYHLDGLRVDAVASMLYLDYSREQGQWLPNEWGGRENLEAIAFLRTLNDALHDACPGLLLCAEESTAWPRVSAPTEEGGLGFDLKWNMGWMNDTLRVFGTDPYARPHEHHRLTFSIHYAFSERFLLPLSHDEVVHLKGSLLSKMPGGYDEKFGNLRLLFGYLWAHPGKKLLFMGGEFGQWSEWDENGTLDWALLDFPLHDGVRRWVVALNRLVRREPALHALDHTPEGFEWLDVHEAPRSVLAFVRWAPEWREFVAVVANFAGARWHGYRLALPRAGRYEVVLDSDATCFGGEGSGPGELITTDEPLHGRPASVALDLPPLSIRFLRWIGAETSS
ncbi:MAG: 1,4-alpha-glucan branching protein GlgB, partial [Gemmatimonadota bacterium]